MVLNARCSSVGLNMDCILSAEDDEDDMARRTRTPLVDWEKERANSVMVDMVSLKRGDVDHNKEQWKKVRSVLAQKMSAIKSR
jgi:hypothetical protein